MPNGLPKPGDLADEEKQASREERGTRRKERRLERELKALKQAQKRVGQATGQAAGRGAQVGATAAGAPIRAAGMAASPFTFGATGVAANVGATAAQQAAYRTGKFVGKQAGGASFRPAVALQKRRIKGVRAAHRRAQEDLAEARAARGTEETVEKGIFRVAMFPVKFSLGLIFSVLASIASFILALIFIFILITIVSGMVILSGGAIQVISYFL